MSTIVAARRTWIGRAGRGHSGQDETTLAAAVLAAAARDADTLRGTSDDCVPGTPPDEVVLGNAAGHGGNVARRAALAGLGCTVPGLTVDRQCASGLAAVGIGAAMVDAGQAGVVIAGGVEHTSRAPRRSDGRAPAAQASFAPPPWTDPDLGAAAEVLAAARGIGRDRQHRYAVLSHERVLAARAAGRYAAETVTLPGLDRDEHARRLEAGVLDRLPAAFRPGGSVTAAATAPPGDGAAAVVLRPDGAPGLRVLRVGAGAVVPAEAPLAPVGAIRSVCRGAGVGIEEVDAIEVVEAFAVQSLAVADDLGIDALADPRWNAGGGALGFGHPFGASGAVAVVRLFSRLVTAGAPAGSLGVAAVAGAGGVATALLAEVVR